MKAVVITKFGGPEVLKIKEVDTPTCTGHQVLIAVKAAGMNRPDVFQRKGNYAAPEGAPADIPGLEISGEIVSTGELVDELPLIQYLHFHHELKSYCHILVPLFERHYGTR